MHSRLLSLTAQIGLLVVGSAGLAFAVSTAALAPAAASAPGLSSKDDPQAARGAYLARMGDCTACHTVPGSPEFSGGLPIQSPLGTIYSTNITPDRGTGIGDYSLQDFDRALREGKSPKHRLYPAMPFPSYTKISSDDIAALYAYFMRGVAPISHQPPKTDLPFPFDQRWGLVVWSLAFFDAGAYANDPGHDAKWNRGAYLVQGLGHCGACHTPRGPAYEERGYTQASSHYLTGMTNDHWFAPNLTGEAATGLGRWSTSDIATFLKTGHGQSMAFGPMKQVVGDSTQYVDDADVASIATYLKSLEAHSADGRYRPLPTTAQQTAAWVASGDVHVPGDGLFMNFCAGCHGADGHGKAGDAPPLAQSALVRSRDPASVIHIILVGGKPHRPPGQDDIEAMPRFGDRFDDREIADVASFVRRSWGNDARPVTARTVEQLRAAVAGEKKSSAGESSGAQRSHPSGS